MSWCNNNPVEEEERAIQLVTATTSCQEINTLINTKNDSVRTISCPSCGHNFELQQDQGGGIINDLPGLPAGVKFDPTDQEILEHLEAKVLSDMRKLHPLIDEFIPTIEGENGICYTHPEKLPGLSNDGQIRHFFHRPSKAYTTGTRKRRKVHTEEEDGSETRWHKTGKTRPVFCSGNLKGFKKILVLYTNYGRQRKPEKTNWVMHQYHLGNSEEEKDGELVVSKVFYQTQPRQCGGSTTTAAAASTVGQKLKNRIIDHDNHNQNNNNNNIPLAANYKNPVLVDYYNPAGFISYDHGHGSRNRENPSQLMPNLVVEGDGSSYMRLAAETSKAKLQRR